MKKDLLLILLTFLLVFFFSGQSLAQVNEYSLVPIDLGVSPVDSTVQVNVNVKTIEDISGFVVLLFSEGTSNPVLDTVLTGGLMSAIPPAFYPPSVAYQLGERHVNPYGPPTNPILFIAIIGFITPVSDGLFCRMFYKVSDPGTLTFRTAIHSEVGQICMINTAGQSVLTNWPAEGEVGSFEVTADAERGDANYDGKLTVADIVYLISYLFKGGPPPFVSKAGDFNCDGQTTVTDVIYLLNYLFKGGPPPPC